MKQWYALYVLLCSSYWTKIRNLCHHYFTTTCLDRMIHTPVMHYHTLKTKTGYGKYRKMKTNLSSFGSLLTITVGNGSMAHDYQPITMEFEVAGLPVAVCLSKPNDELCYPLPIWITWISTQPWKSLCRIYDTLVHIILLKYDAI